MTDTPKPEKQFVGAWSPDWATHVRGQWTERTVTDDGYPEPQDVVMYCSICEGTYQTKCTTGSVKQHVLRFARVHLHADPFSKEYQDALAAKRGQSK